MVTPCTDGIMPDEKNKRNETDVSDSDRKGSIEERVGAIPPPPPAHDEFAEALRKLDEIHERTKSYNPELRQRATDLLMGIAFQSTPPAHPPPSGVTSLSAPISLAFGGGKLAEGSSFSDVVQRWRPATQPEWVLLASYYLAVLEHVTEQTGHEINKVLRHHGVRVLNVTRAIQNCVEGNPATMLQVRKAGSSQQAREALPNHDPGNPGGREPHLRFGSVDSAKKSCRGGEGDGRDGVAEARRCGKLEVRVQLPVAAQPLLPVLGGRTNSPIVMPSGLYLHSTSSLDGNGGLHLASRPTVALIPGFLGTASSLA